MRGRHAGTTRNEGQRPRPTALFTMRKRPDRLGNWGPHMDGQEHVLQPRPGPPAPTTHRALGPADLHGGEVPDAVKLKHNLDVAVGGTLVPPAHVVVARPHVVLVGLGEVVQAGHPIRQLAKPFGHAAGRGQERGTEPELAHAHEGALTRLHRVLEKLIPRRL